MSKDSTTKANVKKKGKTIKEKQTAKRLKRDEQNGRSSNIPSTGHWAPAKPETLDLHWILDRISYHYRTVTTPAPTAPSPSRRRPDEAEWAAEEP
jgi:hypothetical protein